MNITIEKNISLEKTLRNARNPKYDILEETVATMEIGDSFIMTCQMAEVEKISQVKNMLTNLNVRFRNKSYKVTFRQLSNESVRVWKIEK